MSEYTTLARVKANADISGTADDARLTSTVDAVNAWVESYIGIDLLEPAGGPQAAARTFDMQEPGKTLHVSYGFEDVALLEYAVNSRAAKNGDYTTIATTEFVERGPAGQPSGEEPPGWPKFQIKLLPDSTPAFFPAGYDVVRLTPTTGWGFGSVPEDLRRVADVAALRMFQSSQSGDALAIGSTDFGAAIIRFLPEPEYVAIMERYRTLISPSWSG